jgi:uncharacterized protein (TIGR02246 family)
MLFGCTTVNHADEAALAAAVQTYDQKVSSMDSAGIASMFAEDAQLLHDGNVVARGRGEILKFLQTFDGRYKVLENHTVIDAIDMLRGNTASVQAHFTQRTQDLSTKQVSAPAGNLDFLWEHVNGNWMIYSVNATP